MDMFDTPTEDPEKDMPRTRTIELKNNKVHMTAVDPYGFWKLSLERGQLPELFRGFYTTFLDAEKAANQWIADKDKIKV